MSVLEKKHSVAPMKTAKRLESGRFGLPNKPSETPEQLEELVRCGDWGRACEPSPLPPTHGATLQSGSTPDSSPERGAFE